TITANMSNITVGTGNAIGVYAKGMNSVVTGNMRIGANTSVGIASEGNGNVTYTGAITIDDKGTGIGDTASVGIYKVDGTGTITTSVGNWTVGNSGYGIYLKQTAGQSAIINNNADMTLGTSSVGIFSNGANTVNNTGNITVGSTNVNGDHNNTQNHLNSVGMYISGGTIATSSGTITVNHDHSVGVYGEGAGTSFTNTGTINVDNGGVGILVRDGAVAINAAGANINLGGTLALCEAVTVGMASHGAGAKIVNNGIITVNQGAGMLVGVGTTFENNGTIVVNNGVGIEGIGSTVNAGHIIVNGGAAVGSGGLATAQVGAIEIKPDGTIKINGNYTSIGGTLSTAGNIVVDGAYVDVTTGTPLFNAHSVSGEVNILPNFAATGNGRTYEIEGFVNTAMGTITGTKLTPITSPMFVGKITDDGKLVLVVKDYAGLTLGEQFDALYKGLDNLIDDTNGQGRDAQILKELNKYLGNFHGDEFEREASKKLAETRGDIYATIQGRMQDINQAFDNSFYELESSYNLTKDSSKY
ncbi:MAG: autotransporter-associated N-terminal domain-containing protein, partial [Fusobacterium varium]|nr:autotransporter-associated N-terminal domain-containing protein [Fusobacterium varium]